MGNYSAEVNVYSQQGSHIAGKTASNGENVSFENSDNQTGWSSGSVACYYINAENTGDIDIKTYLTFASAFISINDTNSADYKNATKHFSYLVKNVTADVQKSGDITAFAKNNKMPTAEFIHTNGNSFADESSLCAGVVNAGKNSVYALYYCCYDLPDELVKDNFSFILNTSVITTQAGAPDVVNADENAVQNAILNAIEHPQKPTQNTTNVQPTTKPTETVTNTTQQPSTAVPTTVNEWEWKYNDSTKKTVCLTAYNGSEKDIILPSAADGAIVTSLGEGLLDNCSVNSVTVPACVTSFATNTFSSKSLKSLSFQTKTTVLGKVYDSLFVSDSKAIYSADKTALVRVLPQNTDKKFVVPSQVTAIYDNAFTGCSKLEDVSMYKVNSISTLTFAGCKLKNIYLYGTDVLTASGQNVFGAVSDVAIHILPAMKNSYKSALSVNGYSVKADIKTNIYENAVSTEVDGIKYVIIDNNSEYNGVKYSLANYSKIAVVTGYSDIKSDGVVIIPETIVCNDKAYCVASIADKAFANCKKLTQIVLPNHNVAYSSNSFEGCSNLGIVQYNDVLPYVAKIKETAAIPTEESTGSTNSTESGGTEPTE